MSVNSTGRHEKNGSEPTEEKASSFLIYTSDPRMDGAVVSTAMRNSEAKQG